MAADTRELVPAASMQICSLAELMRPSGVRTGAAELRLLCRQGEGWKRSVL